MASGNAVLAGGGWACRFLRRKEALEENKLFRSWKQLVLLGKTSCFRCENNLFWIWFQTRKVTSTWAMMTLMNMPMG